MHGMLKLGLSLIFCVLFINTTFAAERVVVCEVIVEEE